MTNYRTIKRKANVGERILITDAGTALGFYRNGDELTVLNRRSKGVLTEELEGIKGGNFPIYDEEYEVIIGEQSDELYDFQRRLDEAEHKIASLEKVLADKTKLIGDAKVRPTLLPNENRAKVIAKAMSFVVENKTSKWNAYRISNDIGNYICDVKFVVNSKKRTVVALMEGINSGVVRAKGIAKCDPYDVFNADIGKAIALGRALGLDVKEFEQAVQPREVVVGMIVKNTGFAGGTYEIKGVGVSGELYLNHAFSGAFFEDKYAIIIDDTDAKYESEAVE